MEKHMGDLNLNVVRVLPPKPFILTQECRGERSKRFQELHQRVGEITIKPIEDIFNVVENALVAKRRTLPTPTGDPTKGLEIGKKARSGILGSVIPEVRNPITHRNGVTRINYALNEKGEFEFVEGEENKGESLQITVAGLNTQLTTSVEMLIPYKLLNPSRFKLNVLDLYRTHPDLLRKAFGFFDTVSDEEIQKYFEKHADLQVEFRNIRLEATENGMDLFIDGLHMHDSTINYPLSSNSILTDHVDRETAGGEVIKSVLDSLPSFVNPIQSVWEEVTFDREDSIQVLDRFYKGLQIKIARLSRVIEEEGRVRKTDIEKTEKNYLEAKMQIIEKIIQELKTKGQK